MTSAVDVIQLTEQQQPELQQQQQQQRRRRPRQHQEQRQPRAPPLRGGCNATSCERTFSENTALSNGVPRRLPQQPNQPPHNNVQAHMGRSVPSFGGPFQDITNVTTTFGKSGKQPHMLKVPRLLRERAPTPAGIQKASATQLPRTAASGVPPPPSACAARSSVTTHTAALMPMPKTAPMTEVSSNPFEGDDENIQAVAEYVPQIMDDLFCDERKHMPSPNYMESQTDINGPMRAILNDWLVEVHMKYRLRYETLFLTMNIVDRYLTREVVMRGRLQLVGVVAMFIAAKFEEISPPEANDFVYITANAYTKEEVLTTECTMLTLLRFEIAVPTAAHFLQHLQRVNQCDRVQRKAAKYVIELAFLDIRVIQYAPSHLVSAALFLSNEIFGRQPIWPALMAHHSRHTENELHGCVELLRELVKAAPAGALQVVRKKYTRAEHVSVVRTIEDKICHDSTVRGDHMVD